jgi:hypothetical protein
VRLTLAFTDERLVLPPPAIDAFNMGFDAQDETGRRR